MFIKTALLVLRKDFAIEAKSLEIFSTTLLFFLRAPSRLDERSSGNATARRSARSCSPLRPGPPST